MYSLSHLSKDFIYCFTFPHFNWFIAFILLLSILFSIVVTIQPLYNVQKEKFSCQTIKRIQFNSDYKALEMKRDQAFYKAVISTLVHIAIFYYEALGIGYTWNIWMFAMTGLNYVMLMKTVGDYAGRSKGKYLWQSLLVLVILIILPIVIFWRYFYASQPSLTTYGFNPHKKPISMTLLIVCVTLIVIELIVILHKTIRADIRERRRIFTASTVLMKKMFSEEYDEKDKQNKYNAMWIKLREFKTHIDN